MDFNLSQMLNQYRNQEKDLNWEGDFAQYFRMVQENPKLARLAHARIYDMIMAAGTETSEEGVVTYNFFKDDLFGMEASLERFVQHFHSAARRSEVRKRILLLMGPVGGGKSTLVTLLKRGLERYTRTPEGAVYAIKGCPLQEEPLHLIPDAYRDQIERDLGIYIEGSLCPHCQYYLDHDGLDESNHPFGASFVAQSYETVPVVRVTFSEQQRRSIGTYAPSDPKSQDIADLVGHTNYAALSTIGIESDPRTWKFDGKLDIANRGLIEFIEILKTDERFLYCLLTLSQEQLIATGPFADIYADEVILSHTNEHEFTSFVGNKKNEAFHDRMVLIKVPYNLKVSAETQIYRKLIRQSELRDIHIAPLTLETAATFAILSRLEPSSNVSSLVTKLKLYDGQAVEGFTAERVKEIQREAKREGMDGDISPRYVIDRLSAAMIKEGQTCLNPLDALRALRDGLDHRTASAPGDRERLQQLYADTLADYKERAQELVKRAFVHAFDDQAADLFNNYLDNAEAYISKAKLRDPITDEEVEPDERLMRSIEEQIGVADNAKREFRSDVLHKVVALTRRGKALDYTAHPTLRKGIESKLYADLSDAVRVVAGSRIKNEEDQKRFDGVVQELVEHHNFCDECAAEVIRFVGSLAAKQ